MKTKLAFLFGLLCIITATAQADKLTVDLAPGWVVFVNAPVQWGLSIGPLSANEPIKAAFPLRLSFLVFDREREQWLETWSDSDHLRGLRRGWIKHAWLVRRPEDSDDDDTSAALTTNATTVPVPEPSSLFLLGTGLLGAVEAVRRKLRG